MTSPVAAHGGVWNLPPLILYPFHERIPPAALLESSKAALMLSGMVPSDGSDPEDLRRRLRAGCSAEVRMLYYLAKDLLRSIDHGYRGVIGIPAFHAGNGGQHEAYVGRQDGSRQDLVDRTPELRGNGLEPQSFASLLTGDPPANVMEKLVSWGVADYVTVFARAIGFNSIFTEPPQYDLLTSHFLGSYHHHGDARFRCCMELQPFRKTSDANFHFELTLPANAPACSNNSGATRGRAIAYDRSRDQREPSLPLHA